eukprot:COSAG04_NODE_4443_length_2088_cov_2.734037_3_plen_64_part_00
MVLRKRGVAALRQQSRQCTPLGLQLGGYNLAGAEDGSLNFMSRQCTTEIEKMDEFFYEYSYRF